MSTRAFALWCVLAIALALPAAAAAADFEVESFRRSPAHPRLLLAPRQSPESTLVISFDVGSADDDTRGGITRLTQHVLLEANRRGKYEDLALELYRAAATLRLTTSIRGCAFVLTAPSQDFERLARQVLTLVLNPQIQDGEPFNAAVQRTMQDELEPGKGTDTLSALAGKLVDDWRFRNPPYGGDDQIEDMTPAQVRLHASMAFSPANATVILAGQFDAKGMKAFVDKLKGGTPRVVPKPTLRLPLRQAIYSRSELHLLAMPVDISTPASAASLRMAAALIGEKLEQRFRGAGVGYSYDVSAILTPWLDSLVIVLPAHDPSNLDLGPYLFQAIDEVRSGKLDPGAFQRARKSLLNRLRGADGSAAAVAAQLLASGGRTTWYGPEFAAQLMELTEKDFTAYAARWFREDATVYLKFSPSVPRPNEPVESPRPDRYDRNRNVYKSSTRTRR